MSFMKFHCHPIGRSFVNTKTRTQIRLSSQLVQIQLRGLTNTSSCGLWQQFYTNRRLYCSTWTRPLIGHHASPSTTLQSYRRPIGTLQAPRPYVDPKFSYAYGKSQETLIYSTISRELDRQIGELPDEVAVISHVEQIKKTYKQFGQDVDRLAKAMVTKFGIKKNDIVGVFAYNCYNWLLVQFACSRIGATLTPINPSYKGEELAYVLAKGGIKCLFMPGPRSVQAELNEHLEVLQSSQVMEAASASQLALENVIFMDQENDYNMSEYGGKDVWKLGRFGCKLNEWKTTIQLNDSRVFKSTQEADEANVKLEDACILPPDLVSPDDLFAIYYTSGTTGKSKGACCSQFTAINNVRLCQIRLRNGRPRKWRVVAATTLPLFHIFAGVLNALSPVVSNSTIVLSSYKYDIRAYVESMIEHEANITTLTPTMLIDLLTYVEQERLGDALHLKVVQPGGASLPPELVTHSFKILTHLEEVRTGYGSTENGSVATFQTMHEPEATRAQTVGPPLDFTEIRIVKPAVGNGDGDAASIGSDQFQVVPLGEKGEIQTRGYNTMVGYLGDPEKTREALLPSRWYRTGDIGLMHAHGSIEISGRLKHMIIKGGENIYPEEVEQMMHKFECIEKVHVVGVPDKRFGEQVCAWVKLKPGYQELKGEYKQVAQTASSSAAAGDTKLIHRQDIINFCKANMTYFKVPKYLLFVDEFPMTPTKKVQNHVMIERSIELLGLKKRC